MCTNSAGRSPNMLLKKNKNSITARLKDGDKDGRPVEVAMFTSSAGSLVTWRSGGVTVSWYEL